ncbi:MAG TPA: hypothetical protein VIK01_24875 [Polyangiaceae bacterium]
MARSSLATAGTGASGPDEGAPTGADLGRAATRVGARGDGSLGNAGDGGPDSACGRRGGAGGAAERTGAGGALLRAGSGALDDTRACEGNGGGTERVTGRGAGSGFFGEFGSSAMAGINLTRPR